MYMRLLDNMQISEHGSILEDEEGVSYERSNAANFLPNSNSVRYFSFLVVVKFTKIN